MLKARFRSFSFWLHGTLDRQDANLLLRPGYNDDHNPLGVMKYMEFL